MKTSLAGEEGIEPSTTVLETDVIPLHHSPVHRLYVSEATPSNNRDGVNAATAFTRGAADA